MPEREYFRLFSRSPRALPARLRPAESAVGQRGFGPREPGLAAPGTVLVGEPTEEPRAGAIPLTVRVPMTLRVPAAALGGVELPEEAALRGRAIHASRAGLGQDPGRGAAWPAPGTGPSETVGRIANLGLGGACFVSPSRWPIGARVVLDLHAAETPPPLSLLAEVVWCIDEGPRATKLGLRFVDAAPALVRALVEVLESA